eukprot:scaffold19970_cov55-Attheya_sp.AAC.2
MNRRLVEHGYLLTILSWDNFRSWRTLVIGSETDSWFDAIVCMGESEFQPVCHKIMCRLFQILESVMQQSKGDISFFEFEVYKRGEFLAEIFHARCGFCSRLGIRSD